MKKFEIMFGYMGWSDISFGINIDIKAPRVELHITPGYIAIGWEERSEEWPLNWRQLTRFHYLIGAPAWQKLLKTAPKVNQGDNNE